MNESQPSRELQIPIKLAELESAISSLDKAVQSLSARLNRVSIQAPPELEVNPNSKVPVVQLCEYADSISTKAALVRHIRDTVCTIEARLEL
jgi:hypothetical protein